MGWITNGIENKLINKREYNIPEGWSPGRVVKPKESI